MKRKYFILIASILFLGTIHAQNHFNPEPLYGDGSLTVWSIVTIDGVQQTTEDIELAMFFNGQCVNTTIGPTAGDPLYYYQNSTSYNESNTYTVTFKCYNHATEKEYDVCSFSYTTVGGTVVLSSPIPEIGFSSSFTKTIVGYGDTNSSWYLIASPLVADYPPTEGNGFLTNVFDLYRFNQAPTPTEDGLTLEWENWKENDESGHFDLQPGKGYLYANSQGTTLTFIGAPCSNGEVTLSKVDNVEFSGWNLVGNPLPEETYISKPYYYMPEGSSELISTEETTRAINAMEGIFVIADTDGETLAFSTEIPTNNPPKLVINLTGNRGNVIDRSIVRFDNGSTLPKMQLNPNSTKLFIPQEDNDFAIVNAGDADELPLNFKTGEDGVYTLNVNPRGILMEHLILIDNLTGTETDLLQNPNYSFEASKDDPDTRFTLRFGTKQSSCPWVVEDSQGNASLCAVVQIDGVTIEDGTNLVLGAFNQNGACRGLPKWTTIESELPYTCYAISNINGTSGEKISFKLWDEVTGDVFSGICDTTINWVNNGLWGDFFDPVVLRFVSSFTKEILPYDDENPGWYLIASPLADPFSPTEDNGFLANTTYDLYRFNQAPAPTDNGLTLEWENWKNHHFDIESGKGYLYANSDNTTLTFVGVPRNDGEVTLSKVDDVEFSGWNLVGNPLPEETYITKPFYYMPERSAELLPAEDRAVGIMEGIFVIADEDEETIEFSTESNAKTTPKLVMNLTSNRGNVIDRAIIRFDNGSTLPKMQLHSNSTKVFITKGDKDFAVANAGKVDELPLSFQAEKTGTYTFNFSNEGVSFRYLHLIDHLSNKDIDLLANPTYTFRAKPNEVESRFTLSFKASTNVNEDGMVTPISYNGRELSVIGIEGESELQVVDMLGRMVSTITINGDYNGTVNAAPGVYVVRLVNNNNTYTQKIVVE